ncbi:hypothetical protein [Oceanobacillus neutriphilus]|uniref:Uncharacterized protein n=1 Tax=Oceanobacillus neutriphilus TaxID=531815 RepID=A0ABQ2P201_9BACI|nr:hypothetical protein [Oceanobacillus neutriphilus]GGP16153.1 hypothetical protein GCM10011346_46990 [Oceanobacillus neutriphilus]
MSSLVKEHYNNNDINKAEQWLDRGLELVRSLDHSDSIYVYESKVYMHLINGVGSTFEDLILKHVYPFFKEKQLYYEQYRYLKYLQSTISTTGNIN